MSHEEYTYDKDEAAIRQFKSAIALEGEIDRLQLELAQAQLLIQKIFTAAEMWPELEASELISLVAEPLPDVDDAAPDNFDLAALRMFVSFNTQVRK